MIYSLPTFGIAERFAMILEGICRVVAARIGRRGAAVPVLMVVWGRLRRLAARFGRVAATSGDWVAPVPRVRVRGVAEERVADGLVRLPRGRAWLLRMLADEVGGSSDAGGFRSQLEHLLGEPGMAALIAADRRFGRMLRPLCWALGIETGGGRALPVALVSRAPGVAAVRVVAPCEADDAGLDFGPRLSTT